MAKTYNTFTNVSAGSVLTASDYNDLLENTLNYRVPPMCSVYRNAALSHTNSGNFVAIAWDTEHFTQTDSGMWSSGTNPSRITLTTAGVYIVTGHTQPSTSATGIRTLAIYKDGAVDAYGDSTDANATANYCNVSALIRSTGTTYVELFQYQNSGGTINYTVGAATMRFSAVWLGQVS